MKNRLIRMLLIAAGVLVASLPARAQLTFSTTTVDAGTAGANTGQFTSQAIVAGNPAIAYFDATNGDLKFARNTNPYGGGTWTTTTVASTGTVGQYPSLVVVSGNPAISFFDSGAGMLKFARNSAADGSGAWTITTVDSSASAVGQYTSLAIVSGNPAIAYYDSTSSNKDLKFARNSAADGSGTWTVTLVESTNDVGQYASLAVVGGNPAIAYYNAGNKNIIFQRSTTATGSATADWSAKTNVDTAANIGQFGSLVIIGGNPAVTYYDVANGDLKFARNAAADGSGAWTVQIVDSTNNVGQFTSLATMTGSLPAISYYDVTNGDLRFAYNSVANGTGTWTIQSVDTTGNVGQYTSLAYLSVNLIAISYYDATNGDLKWASEVGFPEIVVEQPAGTDLTDGVSSVSFGTVTSGSSASRTFTIKNTGNANLTGLTITKDGTNAADFSVTTSPTAPVLGPTGSTTFTVQFSPTTTGNKTAAIHIASNDSNENPFDITLTGAINSTPTIARTDSASVTVNEGNAASNAGTFSDAEGNATVTVSASLGSISQDNSAGTWSWSYTPPDGAAGPTTVTITATDSGTPALTATTTFTLTVNNVAPAIALTGAATTNEGASYTLNLGGITEPGADTVTAFSVNWGDGTTENFSGSPASTTKTHTYVDGPNSYTIAVSLTDEDGTFAGAGTKAVTVNDVTPTVALTGNASVNEGTSYTLNLGAITDPGTDTVTAYRINWGDGTTQDFSGSPASTAKTHTYTDGSNSYTITVLLTDDDNTLVSAGTKAVTVSNVAPAIALTGAATTNEGASYTLNLGGITEPGADTVTAFSVNWGDGTTESFSGSPASTTKTHTYVDGPNSYTIAVSLTDEDGTFANAGTKAVTVNNVAPTAVAQAGVNAVTINEDAGATAITLAATDPAGANDTTAFAVVGGSLTPPGAGALGIVSGSSVTFTPAANFHGTASFQFVASDEDGGTSAAATVEVVVVPVNDAPTAVADLLSAIDEDSGVRSISFSTLTGNDSAGPVNESAQTLVITTVGSAVGGSVAINGGNVEFTPTLNYSGPASFSYTVEDNGQSGSPLVDDFKTASATVSFTINAVNDIPTFLKGANQTVVEDAGAQNVSGWATAIDDGDTEVQALTFNTSNDNNGLFSVQPAVAANGTLTYTPAANANGSATVTVTLTDDATAGGPALTTVAQTFTITVTAENDAPSFVKGANQTVVEDAGAQNVSGWATAIDDGDTEVQALTFNTSNDNNGLFSVQPAVAANGTLTYTSAANANGSATVTVTLTDDATAGGPALTTAAQTFTITVTAENDAPSFVKGANQTVVEDAGAQTVSGWATSISDGDPEIVQTLTFDTSNDNNALFSVQPAVAANGALTYTLAADAFGTATVSVTLTDDASAGGAALTTAAQTFTITVTPVNDVPVAVADGLTAVNEDSGMRTISFATLLANDSAGPVTESAQTLTITAVGTAVGGTVAINGSNVEFTPAADFNGTASFSYTVQDDGQSGSPLVDDFKTASATVSFAVVPVNDVPVAVADALSAVNEDSGVRSISIASLLGNDSTGPANESGQTLTITAVGSAVGGTVAINGSNVEFTPAADFNGAASFSYTARDNGQSGSPLVDDFKTASATVSFTITAVNDLPSFVKGGNQTVAEDAGVQSVSGWATAISDGDPEVVQALTFNVSNNNNALFSVQPSVLATGTLTYTPAANANGSATVSVTLTDDATAGGAALTSAVQTFTITVTAVNDTPSFVKGADQTVNEDAGAQTAAGWATAIIDGDPEVAQTLTFNVSNDNNALFSAQPTVAANGTLTFTPAANANGSATVTVSLTDDASAGGAALTSATQTFTITVNPVNDTPSFTKGTDKTHPAATNTVQSFSAWATSISAGPANESGQALAFNVSVTSGASLFTTAPAIASNGTLTYTPNGTAGTATMSVTLSDNGGTTNGGVDTSAAQTFTITVQSTPDYSVSTTGGAIVVTDLSGNGDTLAVSEPVATSIAFAASGRTFAVDGGLNLSGSSGTLSLSGITSITVNAAAGADTINVGAFTTALPSLTIDGGVGNDTVNFNGDITFATNANLDVDLQNDNVAPGIDTIIWASGSNLILSGTGAATLRCSRNATFNNGSSLEVVNGNLVVEANRQAIPTSGSFHGLLINASTLKTSGSGAITIAGTGGDGTASTLCAGVFVTIGATVQSTAATSGGEVSITGLSRSTTTANAAYGVEIESSGTKVSSVSGAITINGQSSSAAATDTLVGVRLFNAAVVESTGSATISVTGQGGGLGAGGVDNDGVQISFNNAQLRSSGSGAVTITGTAGPAHTGSEGINVAIGGSIRTADGTASLTLIADTMALAANVTAGTNNVTLRQNTAGVALNLGSTVDTTASTLELSDAELDRVTAGTIQIGNGSSGPITQSAAISRASSTNIALSSGAGIAINTGSLNSAGGNVTLNPGGATNVFTPAASGTDVALSTTGTVSFGSSDKLAIAIDGTTVDSGYQSLKVTGLVDLTGAVLSLSGGYTAVGGDSFVIVENDGADAITGTFTGLAQGALVNFNGVPLAISYVGGDGNDVTLSYAAPVIVRNNASVTVNEGSLASNSGTFGDQQGNGTVTITASIGSVSQNSGAGTWNWSFTPADGPAGPTTVTITATDANSLAATTTFTLAVNDVAPTIALTGNASVNEGASYTLNLGAISDSGTDTVTAYSIDWGDGATENYSGNPASTTKLHTYADGPASRTIAVALTNEDGTFTSAGTKVVSVLNVPPTAIAQTGANAVTVEEDSAATMITFAATDPAGVNDTLGFAVVGGSLTPSGAGTLGTVAGNQVSFTPAANFFGTARFEFIAADEDGGTSAVAAVEVVVVPVNDVPVAVADTLSAVNEDSGVRTISFASLLGNDSTGPANESGQTLTITGVGSAVGGTVVINGSNVEFTPAADFNGAASFSYTARDNGQSGSPLVDDFKTASATVSFTINAVNDTPSFVKGANQTVSEDAGAQSVSGWATAISDSDPEVVQTLSFNVSNDNSALFSVQPTIAANGTLSYTPAANANGSATVSVTLTDDATAGGAALTSATQTFRITVTAVNDTPSFVKGANQTVNEDAIAQSVSGWATAISDGDGEVTQTLTFNVSNDNNALFSAQPAVAANGTLTFTLAADAFGSATVTVTLTDDATAGGPALTTAAQTFAITIVPVNDVPTAVADTLAAVDEDSGLRTISFASLTANDGTGPANESTQTLTITAVGSAVGGTAAINGSNVEFTPTANFNGMASFSYTLRDDGQSGSPLTDDFKTAEATVSFAVNIVNDLPVAANDTLTSVNEDSGVRTIAFSALIANDNAGPNESGQTLTVTSVGSAVGGTVAINGSDVEFTPAVNFNGAASFSYTIQDDGQSGSPAVDDFKTASATASFTVNAVNDAPSFTKGGDQTHFFGVTAAQSFAGWATAISAGPVDEAGQVLTFSANVSGDTIFTTAPAISSTGTLTYTPNGTAGTATVSVTLSDDGGTAFGGVNTSAAQTFTITIQPPPEILVHNGATTADAELTDGQSEVVTFGAIVGTPVTRSFTIENTGTGPMSVSGVNVPAGFTVASVPSTVAAGASATFTVTLTAATAGTFAGSVVVHNNDADEGDFDFPVQGSVVDGPTLVATSAGNTNYVVATPAALVDSTVTLTGAGAMNSARVSISANYESGDTLGFTASGGITGSFDATRGVLELQGTAGVAAYQTVLRSVSFVNTNSGATLNARTVTFTTSAAVFGSANGHFYEFVPTSLSWTAAKAAAETRSLYGMSGYLATVTTAAENTLISGVLRGAGWLGASDVGSDKAWKWMTGPDAGQVFFYQAGYVAGGPNAAGSGASLTQPLGSFYVNWTSGQPDDAPDGIAGREDYASLVGTGFWADLASTASVPGYVVEYGGQAGELNFLPLAGTLAGTSADKTVRVVNSDYGDLPASYGVARHFYFNTDARLGALRDHETMNLASATATGDDASGASDEDGLLAQSVLVPGRVGSLTVDVENVSSPGFLNAWVDWNNDGDFNDANEQVGTNVSVATNGPRAVNFTVPAGATAQGLRALRLRVGTTAGMGPAGDVEGGEGEDYFVRVGSASDSTRPTATFVAVTPDPRQSAVGLVTLNFNEDVTGVDASDFRLVRDSGSVNLAGLPFEEITPRQYTIDLSDYTGDSGTYVVRLTASGSGIIDYSGNAFSVDATDTFVVEIPPQAWQFTPTNLTDSVGSTLGSQFAITQDYVVTHLGFYDGRHDGLTGPHTVSLWKADGTLLASIVVQPSDPLLGNFRYHALPSNVILRAGASYVIAGIYDTVEEYDYNAQDFITSSGLAIEGARSIASTSGVFPSTYEAGVQGYFGADFLGGVAEFAFAPRTGSTTLDILASKPGHTLVSVVNPTGGSAVLSGNKVRFTLTNLINGGTFTYTARDATGHLYTATVVVRPLPSPGRFVGLLHEGDANAPVHGLFDFTYTSATGSGTGYLWFDGKRYSFKGTLTTSGKFLGTSFPLTTSVGAPNDDGQLTLLFNIPKPGQPGVMWTGSAELVPATVPQTGRYTMVMRDPAATHKVAGYLSLEVTARNTAIFKGRAGTGKAVTLSSAVYSNGGVPTIFGSGSGALAQTLGGMLQFDSNLAATPVLHGTCQWRVPAVADARLGGVDHFYPVTGARYNASETVAGTLQLNSDYAFTVTAGTLSFNGALHEDDRGREWENYTKYHTTFHTVFGISTRWPFLFSAGAVHVPTGLFYADDFTSSRSDRLSGVILQGAGLNYGVGVWSTPGRVEQMMLTPKP